MSAKRLIESFFPFEKMESPERSSSSSGSAPMTSTKRVTRWQSFTRGTYCLIPSWCSVRCVSPKQSLVAPKAVARYVPYLLCSSHEDHTGVLELHTVSNQKFRRKEDRS